MRSKPNEQERKHDNRNYVSIVEKDISVRRALERLCRSAGYETESYYSAEAYLAAKRGAAIRDNQCDCLIVELQLPGMNGLELHAELQAGPNPIPVVLISASENESTRQQAAENGVLAFLRKPFHTDDLLNALRKTTGSA